MDKRTTPTRDTSRIGQLPDDVLVLILSFLPTLAEIARTSILSQRWRNLWHHGTCLDFDATTVLPLRLLEISHAWYVAWVNNVIDARASIPGLPLVKELRIWYELNTSQAHHIDRWISFAIANQVEKLHLEFSRYEGIIAYSDQYQLSEEPWHRAPSGLSSLKCLKSLFLSCVNVSKQFIEFILASCPHLEDLSLDFAGSHSELDVSGVPPLRLKRLKICLGKEFSLTKLDAPCLTSLYYESSKLFPQKIDVPMLADLCIGGHSSSSPPITNYLDHFWNYLPQLEKLELLMHEAGRFRLNKMPELVNLKYLKICVTCGGYNPIFCEIIDFINACPVLETFALEMSEGDKDARRQLRRRGQRQSRKEANNWCNNGSFRRLKVLELYGADGKTIDQEVTKCIIWNAPHLEKLVLDVRIPCVHPNLLPSEFRIVRVVEEKAKRLCQGSRSDIEIIVIG